MPEERACTQCGASEVETTLRKCPICFRLVCVACAYRAMGRYFCSRSCSDIFFFGDEDEA
jgi:hypothetical protein